MPLAIASLWIWANQISRDELAVICTPEKRPHILRGRPQQAIERLVREGRTGEEAEVAAQ